MSIRVPVFFLIVLTLVMLTAAAIALGGFAANALRGRRSQRSEPDQGEAYGGDGAGLRSPTSAFPESKPRSRRLSRNLWYWSGLAILLAAAFFRYWRLGFLAQLATMEGRAEHREQIYDILAFVVAAALYPFVVDSLRTRRSRRRSPA